MSDELDANLERRLSDLRQEIYEEVSKVKDILHGDHLGLGTSMGNLHNEIRNEMTEIKRSLNRTIWSVLAVLISFIGSFALYALNVHDGFDKEIFILNKQQAVNSTQIASLATLAAKHEDLSHKSHSEFREKLAEVEIKSERLHQKHRGKETEK